jgi:hypothetical protein
MSQRGAALRRFAVLGGLGAAMLARPRDVVRMLCGDAPMPPVVLVRVLGARQLVQELVVLAAPSRRVLVGAAATDVMHAVSMVAAALVWPEYRRPALTSAAAATGSAGLAAAAAPSRLRAGRGASRTY